MWHFQKHFNQQTSQYYIQLSGHILLEQCPTTIHQNRLKIYKIVLCSFVKMLVSVYILLKKIAQLLSARLLYYFKHLGLFKISISLHVLYSTLYHFFYARLDFLNNNVTLIFVKVTYQKKNNPKINLDTKLLHCKNDLQMFCKYLLIFIITKRRIIGESNILTTV